MKNELLYIDGFKSNDRSFKSSCILIDLGGVYIECENLRHVQWLADQFQQIHDEIERERENAKSNQ